MTKDNSLKKYTDYFKDEISETLVNSYGLSYPKKWNISIEQRINSTDLYQIIAPDLTEQDLINIKVNVQAFDNNIVQF